MSRADYLFEIAKLAVDYGFTPIPTRGKVPVGRNWQNIRNDPADKYKNARRVKHLAKIKRAPADNLAILAGEASNVVVFDLDSGSIPYWNSLVQANKNFPETFIVQTPNDGFHVYFQYDQRMTTLTNSNRVMGQKIDFRTNGGVVAFPGSRDKVTGKEYKVFSGYRKINNVPIPLIGRMPDWLLGFIMTHQLSMK